jgi:hypothetical protein
MGLKDGYNDVISRTKTIPGPTLRDVPNAAQWRIAANFHSFILLIRSLILHFTAFDCCTIYTVCLVLGKTSALTPITRRVWTSY